MRKQISEAQLRNIVHDVIMEEARAQYLNEQELNEISWNQVKTGVNSFFGNSPTRKQVEKGQTPTMNLSGRAKAGWNNYKLQGQQDEINKAMRQIVSICQRYNIPTNKTIDELTQIGGGLQQRAASMSSQMKKNVQNIYK